MELAGAGALTGAVDAALWGNDVGKGALFGAASGAVFTTVTSENLSNALKGKKFKTNANVFKDFKAGAYTLDGGVWQQDALNYFGFDGKYVTEIPKGGEFVQGNEFYGATNPTTGSISYGDLAFDSYGVLKNTYVKESFTSQRVLSGEGPSIFKDHELLSTPSKSVKYYPEEALGFKNAYFNGGLYPQSTINNFGQANSYWMQVYGERLIPNKSFFYNIPRRW